VGHSAVDVECTNTTWGCELDPVGVRIGMALAGTRVPSKKRHRCRDGKGRLGLLPAFETRVLDPVRVSTLIS
jgi:hypothetical protein